MSWPEVTGTAEIESVISLVRPWLHVGDVRRPAVLIDLPFGPYDFDAVVVAWDGPVPEEGRERRAAMLARAEDALAAVEAAGWLPAECPRFSFGGSLERPVCTLDHRLVKPAVQYPDLRVEFSVVRL